jgi:cellulose synthase/poly-beta-1,6-N-acetylglucosamine synthase-like glycosyltransferase
VIPTIAVGILGATSLVLLGFGLNLLYLTWRATRLKPVPRAPIPAGSEPDVCVQLPIYNERYVAERVIDAVCALDWPPGQLEVQVLDDSDDETRSIVARRVSHWRRHGIRIAQVTRSTREGFKAGALAHGLTLTAAPFIAIFDADFVPPPDFLRRTLGAFDDPSVGFAQARWGHLDEGYSWFTRLQALAIDFHFLVEQAVRSAEGYFTNFTGTAGVWRRTAVDDSGGWSARTLTEDLDLSYRAQLRGWRAAYVEDLVVPEELPVSIDAYRRQQSRWATGSFQTAFLLLVPVLRSTARAAVKFQATVHLLAYGVGPLMLVQLACYPFLLLTAGRHGVTWQLATVSIWFNLLSVSPWIGFMVAQTRRGRPWWSGLPALLCQVIGSGMSLTVMIALTRATRRGGEFVRTPKHQIVQRGQEWRDQAYVRVGDPRAISEAVLGIGALAMVPAALGLGQRLIAAYTTLFAVGFLTVAVMTAVEFLEVITLRSLGQRALARLRVAAPALALLTALGALLLLASAMPEPFEDGYGHWLIAVNFASTGHLHDPLFGMEDTWLPGYHVLAAAVLRVFGLWQLGALKALGAMLGLTTLACVYALAPNGRQGRLAVGLLALNPVFLFTSGSAVVEPLLTTLLTGAGLAAVRGRMKVAALLAAGACLTATKAWIWIAAVAGAVVLARAYRWSSERGLHPLPNRYSGWRARAAVLAVPAIALLVFLQLGFAPASQSIARGSVEVASATARGSLPAGAISRLIELASTFGLAALPLFLLAPLGVYLAIRGRQATVLRFVVIPAAAYLAVVFALVTAGAYSGSHRYLYPALPALALLAATVLDRHPLPIRLGTLLAGALLTVGFIPVFASFAADNAGLIAAGRAAQRTSGRLVTDSPVAAFYSGKLPAEITGSQAMPTNHTDAIAWMRARGVTALVVEGISYYRATAVFPELAAGRPTPPFESLGNQSLYQVSGGKPVYAYGLGSSVNMQQVYPGLYAVVASSLGEGKTAPLAKGVTLDVAGASAAGEGIGFGVPIVHYPDGWVYSRTATTVDLSTTSQTVWKRTFELDEIGGDAAHAYVFVPIASRGQIEVTYTVDSTGISITVRTVQLSPDYTQVGILNEQSAEFNDFADSAQTLVGSAFGNWIPAAGPWARLRSGSLGTEWSAPAVDGAQLFAGRELQPPGFNWAGLDYIFPAPFAGTTYEIKVQEAK